MQDFGEPIVLTVSSVSNPEVWATCYINYYQRVKSCDFAIYYDGVEVTPTIENGVYKLDYTGAEKDYTVELRPVYSAYTLTDTYTTTTSGALTSAFGYTALESMNTLKMSAGVSGGDIPSSEIDALGDALLTFSNSYVGDKVDSFTYCTRLQNAETAILNAGFSTHPRYLHYKEILNSFSFGVTTFYGNTVKYLASAPDASVVHSRVGAYKAPDYIYYGAAIATYNDFVAAVQRCNNSGVGVIEYIVTINGTHSKYETVLSLSYNNDFKTNVQDITLSDPNVNF